MPGIGIALKLLGFGKTILGFFLGILKDIMGFAEKHPILFCAILLDIVLLYGCYRGYKWHMKANAEASQITNLKSDNAGLSMRLKQYSKALTEAQQQLVDTITDNNKAIDRLKQEADKQKARAEAEAAKVRAVRDQYVVLEGKYAKANPSTGTAEERLAREQATNRQFITDFQKVKR